MSKHKVIIRKIVKHGNSKGLNLTSDEMEYYKIKVGDFIEFEIHSEVKQ